MRYVCVCVERERERERARESEKERERERERCIVHAYIQHTYMHTVRLREMETGISEASKRVPIDFFLCYPGRQASEFLFSTEELGPQAREAQIRFPAG